MAMCKKLINLKILFIIYRRSPRNRSSSPYDRTRSPHRYGSSRRYEPKRVRSPLLPRDRSRSPLRNNKIDGMDTKSGSAIVSTSPDQRSRNDNGIVQSKIQFFTQLCAARFCLAVVVVV